MWGVCGVAGGLCEIRGSLGSELCGYSMTSEGVNTPNQNFVEGGDGYFTVFRKYTLKESPQHLQIHACGVYVGLLVDCVRSGGPWEVNYVSIR